MSPGASTRHVRSKRCGGAAEVLISGRLPGNLYMMGKSRRETKNSGRRANPGRRATASGRRSPESRRAAVAVGTVAVMALALLLVLSRAPVPITELFGSVPDAAELCSDAVEWSSVAANPNRYRGAVFAVTGTVASAVFARHVDGRPTFLNIGAPHPQRPRFEAVIWDEHRGSFLDRYPGGVEVMLEGQRICVAGMVNMHDGVPQIELRSPSQLEIMSPSP